MGWGIENLKTPGPHGVGNSKFQTPGSPWGGEFEYPWGIPNTINKQHILGVSLRIFSGKKDSRLYYVTEFM